MISHLGEINDLGSNNNLTRHEEEGKNIITL